MIKSLLLGMIVTFFILVPALLVDLQPPFLSLFIEVVHLSALFLSSNTVVLFMVLIEPLLVCVG